MKVIYANSFFERLIGLSFKKEFDYILGFKKCSAIHTFFMRKKIDIIMTNQAKEIIFIFKNVPPNRIIIKKNVYYVFEIPIPNNFDFKLNQKIPF